MYINLFQFFLANAPSCWSIITLDTYFSIEKTPVTLIFMTFAGRCGPGVGWFWLAFLAKCGNFKTAMTSIHEDSLTSSVPKIPKPSRNPLCYSHQRGRIVLDIQHCWRGSRCNLNCGMFLQALLKWFCPPSFWLPLTRGLCERHTFSIIQLIQLSL